MSAVHSVCYRQRSCQFFRIWLSLVDQTYAHVSNGNDSVFQANHVFRNGVVVHDYTNQNPVNCCYVDCEFWNHYCSDSNFTASFGSRFWFCGRNGKFWFFVLRTVDRWTYIAELHPKWSAYDRQDHLQHAGNTSRNCSPNCAYRLKDSKVSLTSYAAGSDTTVRVAQWDKVLD